MPSERISCCVPFCKRTRVADEPEEWLCSKHYAAIPRALRVEYDAAWKEADKADRRALDGLEVSTSVYVRVTVAWDACKAAAIEAAAGI